MFALTRARFAVALAAALVFAVPFSARAAAEKPFQDSDLADSAVQLEAQRHVLGHALERELPVENQVVTVLADAIRTSADGVTTAALVARALSMLDEEYRARAMTALLSSPPVGRPDTGRPGSAR